MARRSDPDRDKMIARLYQSGLTADQVATAVGMSASGIFSALKRLGIVRRRGTGIRSKNRNQYMKQYMRQLRADPEKAAAKRAGDAAYRARNREKLAARERDRHDRNRTAINQLRRVRRHMEKVVHPPEDEE